ncbi:hypothetical protein AOLI_G00020440 [Acnodon oligacanthus]
MSVSISSTLVSQSCTQTSSLSSAPPATRVPPGSSPASDCGTGKSRLLADQQPHTLLFLLPASATPHCQPDCAPGFVTSQRAFPLDTATLLLFAIPVC